MNPAAYRSAVRSGAKPSMKSSAIGFRVVAEPPPRPS
jgi:formylglycine-generating enzyme required for sulfatase activity